MQLQVTGSDEATNLEFDYYGNVYFSFGGRVYQLNVDGRNHLQLLDGDYHILGTHEDTKLMVPSQGMSLNKKIREEREESDDDENDDDDPFIEDRDYWNEDSDSEDILFDEDNMARYGLSNQPFIFWSTGDQKIPVNYRQHGDISSLYDTYVYRYDDILFRSSSRNEQSIYRLVIRDDALLFRTPGETGSMYRLSTDDAGELVCQMT